MELLQAIIGVATFEIPKVNLNDLTFEAGLPEDNDFCAADPNRQPSSPWYDDPTFIGPCLLQHKNAAKLVESLGELDYESHLLAANLGTPYLFLPIWIVIAILATVLWPMRNSSACFRRMHNYLVGCLFWNFLLRYLIEDSMQVWFAG